MSRAAQSSNFASGLAPLDLAFDPSGNLFVAGSGDTIFKFAPNGTKSTFASGLSVLSGLAFDGAGNLFVTDRWDSRAILKFSPDGTKTTFASGLEPEDLTFDRSGNLFVTDFGRHSILKFSPDGTKSTFASGLGSPYFEAFDGAGNLFVSERDSGRILKFAPDGTKSTFPKGTISPDKQWEYQWPDGEKPVILKAGTTQTVLDLSENEAVPFQWASQAKVVWAPDSKRFAFNYGHGRTHQTLVYQLRDDQWVATRLPRRQ